MQNPQEVADLGQFRNESGIFSGLGVSEVPVTICQTRTLDPVLSLNDALPVLEAALNGLENLSCSKSGVIRIQVLTLRYLVLSEQPHSLDLLHVAEYYTFF